MKGKHGEFNAIFTQQLVSNQNELFVGYTVANL